MIYTQPDHQHNEYSTRSPPSAASSPGASSRHIKVWAWAHTSLRPWPARTGTGGAGPSRRRPCTRASRASAVRAFVRCVHASVDHSSIHRLGNADVLNVGLSFGQSSRQCWCVLTSINEHPHATQRRGPAPSTTARGRCCGASSRSTSSSPGTTPARTTAWWWTSRVWHARCFSVMLCGMA